MRVGGRLLVVVQESRILYYHCIHDEAPCSRLSDIDHHALQCQAPCLTQPLYAITGTVV